MALTLDELKQIRTLTIISLFSDDDLMDTLVLKGGNALEIGYGFNSRSSVDIDLSMVKDFATIGLESIQEIEARLHKVLESTFSEYGYQVFDVKLKTKPKKLAPEIADFWGGYEANFKIIELERYEEYKNNYTRLTARSIAVAEDKKNSFVAILNGL
uniref:nucleotidyl transferase AbiEii/AbiGii toxin family protein n=1 Tax=Paenibacillus elgii TaxID=189691 RepID=UPI000248BFB6